MSQRAPPEVNGFGTMTSTSSRTRSSQSWMSSGLPLRTVKATTDCSITPSYLAVSQSESTSPASTRRVEVRGDREVDEVGGLARLDRS